MNKLKTKLNKIVDIIIPYIVPIILFLMFSKRLVFAASNLFPV